MYRFVRGEEFAGIGYGGEQAALAPELGDYIAGSLIQPRRNFPVDGQERHAVSLPARDMALHIPGAPDYLMRSNYGA